jgi:hypothetical protein
MAPATPPIWRDGHAAGELAALLRSPVWSDPPPAPVAGQPVLLVPGLLASDSTLTLMARWLKRAGYAPPRSGAQVRASMSC